MIRRGEDFFQVYILVRLAQQLSAREGQRENPRARVGCDVGSLGVWNQLERGSHMCGSPAGTERVRGAFAVPRPRGAQNGRGLRSWERPLPLNSHKPHQTRGRGQKRGKEWRRNVLPCVRINYANCFEVIISFGFIVTESWPLKLRVFKALQPGLSDLAFESWWSS